MAKNKKNKKLTSPHVTIQNNLKKLPVTTAVDFQAIGAINDTSVNFSKYFKKIQMTDE